MDGGVRFEFFFIGILEEFYLGYSFSLMAA